jgi:hypothetical protein
VSTNTDDDHKDDAVSVDALMAPAEDGAAEAAPETSGLVAIVEALVFASPEPIT